MFLKVKVVWIRCVMLIGFFVCCLVCYVESSLWCRVGGRVGCIVLFCVVKVMLLVV